MLNTKDLDNQLKEVVTKHLNKMSLEEAQKIFNQHLDYDVVASEYAYYTEDPHHHHSDNNWGDLDKNKEWLVEQLVEASMNDHDGCATLGELACQLGVDASGEIDYEEIINLYDEPMERAIARELFKMDQDQLRALLEESIELDELVEWHELKLNKSDIEKLISEDKVWVAKEIILHGTNLDDELRIRPQRRYLTVEVFGYDLNSTIDVRVTAMSVDGDGSPLDKIYSDVISMTDEDGGII